MVSVSNIETMFHFKSEEFGDSLLGHVLYTLYLKPPVVMRVEQQLGN